MLARAGAVHEQADSGLGGSVLTAAQCNGQATPDPTAAALTPQADRQETTTRASSPVLQILVRHEHTLTVDGLRAADDVSVLAACIERKTRVPRANSWIDSRGKRLEPGRSLGACGLSAGSTVHLAVRGRP